MLIAPPVAVLPARVAAAEAAAPRATGYVEATDVRVAAKVRGRVETVSAAEGARVDAGATSSPLSTTDVDLALRRARAERAQAVAQLQLLRAGSRAEDIRQAEAQVAAAAAADRKAAEAELSPRARTKRGSSSCCTTAPARRSSATMPWRGGSSRRRGCKAAADRVRGRARRRWRA